MEPISFQLYSARQQPLADTLVMLSRLGYEAVEGYGPVFENIEQTRQMLTSSGLRMPTAHFGIDLVSEQPALCLQIAETLGIEAVIVPFLPPGQRPSDGDGWRELGKRLSAISQPISDAGLDFGWHNHDFEFKPCADGALPIERLIEGFPGLRLELDLAWVQVAGQNPIAWIDTFADRLLAVHVKDVAASGENVDEDGWADVGHGVMDWSGITAALKKAGVPRCIVEHDKPSDVERFARRSLAAVQEFDL